MGNRTAIAPAAARPCAACPWLLANHGRRHPDGWYRATNLRRLWAGLRTGEAPGMSCHPTDPDNPVPEGWRGVPVGTVTRECAGAQTLVQRELRLFERLADQLGIDAPILRIYRALRPRGLTRAGLAHWVHGQMLAGTPFGPPNAMTAQPLDHPVGIDHDGLPWPVTDHQISAVFVEVG